MTVARLKPCPFCGGDVRLREVTDGNFLGLIRHVIRCLSIKCTVSPGVDRATPELAIHDWNTRTTRARGKR